MAGDTFHQHHSGSGHNIGKVSIGYQRFELTDEVLAQIAATLDRSRPVNVWVRSSPRGARMFDRLRDYLTSHGFRVGGVQHAGHILTAEGELGFDQPITLSHDGLRLGGLLISPGGQVIAIEPDA